jgi:hypothetical protein
MYPFVLATNNIVSVTSKFTLICRKKDCDMENTCKL